MRLDRLLAPRSVAVVGATERPGSYGGEALLNLQRARLSRARCGRSTRRDRRSTACRACRRCRSCRRGPRRTPSSSPFRPRGRPAWSRRRGGSGAAGAVVFAAGFAEARANGADQDALAAAAFAHDLPVCGPNGNGHRRRCTRARRCGATWSGRVEPGPVALVSQSGNVAVNALGSRRGLRLHTVVSCGNQAVLAAEDYLEALADARRRAVGRAVPRGRRRRRALVRGARALRPGGGRRRRAEGAARRAAGAAAAAAHTAAVAGDQRAFRAFVEECGRGVGDATRTSCSSWPRRSRSSGRGGRRGRAWP